jgi:phage/plasmid-associated DNA primase
MAPTAVELPQIDRRRTRGAGRRQQGVGASEDHIARWIEECCVTGARSYAKGKLLYESYCSWCDTNHEKPLNSKDFGADLERRGYEWSHTEYGNIRAGIALAARTAEGG